MLCLSRRVGERIFVGEGENAVVITVVRAGHGMVRIGVEARRRVQVVREELLSPEEVARHLKDVNTA